MPHRVGLAAGLLWALTTGSTRTAEAQDTQTNHVTATVPGLGAVLDVSPLAPGNRLPTADLFVSGTVTTRHNGPYRLQARLTTPFTDPGSGAVNQVQARTPSGLLVTLGTTDWETVATGPGGTGLVNPVEYLVLWGQGSPRTPNLAVQVPVEYQVVPP